MAIISFGFHRMEAEKTPDFKGKVSINNNVTIKSVDKADLFLGKTKQEALRFGFEYGATYEPKLGKITLSGDFLYMEDSEKVTQILDKWKKDKKINAELFATLANGILSRCNVQALILSRDVGLPAPFEIPRVSMQKK